MYRRVRVVDCDRLRRDYPRYGHYLIAEYIKGDQWGNTAVETSFEILSNFSVVELIVKLEQIVNPSYNLDSELPDPITAGEIEKVQRWVDEHYMRPQFFDATNNERPVSIRPHQMHSRQSRQCHGGPAQPLDSWCYPAVRARTVGIKLLTDKEPSVHYLS
jgi:hypothetical protein